MKRFILLLILNLTFQCAFAQACGKYRLKYVGEIKTNSVEILSIKLPTPMYLQGSVKSNSDFAFEQIIPSANKIELEIYSGLTSVFENDEALLRLYKNKTKFIPLQIITKRNGKVEESILEITWDQINFRKINDDKLETIFELDLNEILIEPAEIQLKQSNESEIIIKLILDLPNLQWVYHPQLTGRIPLKILESNLENKNLSIIKFDQKVRILSKLELDKEQISDFIEFKKLEIKSTTVHFELSYKAEGVKCNGELLKKNGKWVVVEYTLTEN